MTVLVNRCYDWVSFHLINELLNNGYNVIGINDSKNGLSDHLSMFLGRNSSFTEGVTNYQNFKFQSVFLMGPFDSLGKLESDRLIVIKNNNQKAPSYKTKIAQTIIEPPLLFGEWMPMNEKGMYKGEQFITFDSKYFKEQAVFIEDFCKVLCSWLQDTSLPSTIDLYSSKRRKNKAIKLENSVYIHDNRPIMENLEDVLTHFKKFRRFYLT